jgi:hypothetical protein
MDRFYHSHTKLKMQADCLFTAFVALFVATKNCEVDPLSLGDIQNHFLKRNYSTKQILQKELEIRTCINMEIEVPTLFEIVMIYSKLWKIGCQKQIKNWYLSTHKFLCEVESAAYDFSKSLLIDAHCLKMKPTILIAAVFSASIEIALRLQTGEADNDSPVLS